MNNSPWECPRCGKINAPFNPSCFCKPKEEAKPLNHIELELLEKFKTPPKDLFKDFSQVKKWPPLPMYKEHGWLATQDEAN